MDQQAINRFLLGALVMGCFIAGLFFLRFWRKTRDRLFVIFSIAFVLLAANWLLVAVLRVDEDKKALFYVLRLLAFIAIIVGIVDKNRVRQ